MTARVAGSSPVTSTTQTFSCLWFTACSLMDRMLVCEINDDGSSPSKIKKLLKNKFYLQIIILIIIEEMTKSDPNTEKIRRAMNERRFKALNEKIARDREIAFEKWKREISESQDPTITKEERDKRRKELLNFVHRYVFEKKLGPVEKISVERIKLDYEREQSISKGFLQGMVTARNFLGAFFKIRAIMLLTSAFFFSAEYWLHYYTSFSLKDVSITYQDVIEKIPPFR